ncbi:MAG: tetratricopeptide repeat protein [Thermonemataceae bacterium]
MKWLFPFIWLYFLLVPQVDQAQSIINNLNEAIQQAPIAQNYLNRAYYYFANSYFKKAIRDMDTLLVLQEDNTAALLLRGKAKLALEDYSGAINDFNRVIYYQPDSGAAYYQRGIVRKRNEDAVGACEDFKKAVALGESATKISSDCR